MKRTLRIAGTVVFTSLAVAYLVWKIDLGKTADVLRHANLWWFALAIGIMIVTVFPMALRWKSSVKRLTVPAPGAQLELAVA